MLKALVSVQAVGLNFRDALNVLGAYPGDPGEPGTDVAGVIAALGPGAASSGLRCACIALLARPST